MAFWAHGITMGNSPGGGIVILAGGRRPRVNPNPPERVRLKMRVSVCRELPE